MTNDQLRRFISNVVVNPDSGCWEWSGGQDKDGYGEFLSGRAHRVAFLHWKGPVREGRVLDHLCRVRHCVNPMHLRVVLPRVNTFAPGSRANAAVNAAKTHCVHGHPLSGRNLYVRNNGTRMCLECNRARARSYRGKGIAAKVVKAIKEG